MRLVLLSARRSIRSGRIIARRGAVEKKTVLENLDLALLAIDEIIDRGCAPALATKARAAGSTCLC